MHKIHDTISQLAVPLDGLTPYGKNPRQGNVEAIKESLQHHGQYKPIVVRTGTNEILAGNHTAKAARELGWTDIAATFVDVTDDQAARIVLVDNRTNDLAGYDDALLQQLLESLPDLDGTGFQPADLENFTDGAEDAATNSTLVERFGMPPFTVLDARSGPWRERKQAWKSLGIQSELGRTDDLLWDSPQTRYANWYEIKNVADTKAGRDLTGKEIIEQYGDQLVEFADSGTSIFDPVLSELMYRWFSPIGGHILDPWAGGSVRGIVASRLGRQYTGIELRAEQVEANQQQQHLANAPLPVQLAAAPGMSDREPEPPANYTPDITPVETHGGFYVKREDAWSWAGASGAKSRAMFTAAQDAAGIITAGSRNSAQIERGALVAKALGIPCRIHTGFGKDTPELATARRAGAEILQAKPARLTVIKKRFTDDAEDHPDWAVFPFGMDHPTYLQQVAEQTKNIPEDTQRVVVPYGSGMTLAAVLNGLADHGREKLPVLAVSVGQSSHEYLDKYAPGWRSRVEIVEHPSKYEQPATTTRLGDLELDPIYEAKCIEYLRPGDLLWTVGVRHSVAAAEAEKNPPPNPEPYWIIGESTEQLQKLPREQYDMVLGCPPYYDLEVYSDDPRDMSNLAPADFDAAMIENIKAVADRMKPNSYAIFVVGAVRNNKGHLMDMRSLMVRAAGEAGLHLHNDAILLTAAGTVAIRAARSFIATRVLGRVHQDILIFLKGDRKEAAAKVHDGESAASLELLETYDQAGEDADE